MDQGLAAILQGVMTLIGALLSAIIMARATIYAAHIAREVPYERSRIEEDHRDPDEVGYDDEVERDEPSKLIRLLGVAPGFVAPVVFVLAAVAMLIHVPFVSDHAFWFVVAAYIMLGISYRPPATDRDAFEETMDAENQFVAFTSSVRASAETEVRPEWNAARSFSRLARPKERLSRGIKIALGSQRRTTHRGGSGREGSETPRR
jgi:hypothetical protein